MTKGSKLSKLNEDIRPHIRWLFKNCWIVQSLCDIIFCLTKASKLWIQVSDPWCYLSDKLGLLLWIYFIMAQYHFIESNRYSIITVIYNTKVKLKAKGLKCSFVDPNSWVWMSPLIVLFTTHIMTFLITWLTVRRRSLCANKHWEAVEFGLIIPVTHTHKHRHRYRHTHT